ncbi:MAG: alpha/beta hydrolase [Acidobacteria bacterium]|nr:alpha/beta hydrolase [Acidobacteriota bacterium]
MDGARHRRVCRARPGPELLVDVQQIEDTLDRANVDRAVLVGASYGGLVASEFAARRSDRVQALVLASALPIGWQPDRRAAFYMRAPLALSPLFVMGAPLRLYPEVAAAYPELAARWRFFATQGGRVVRAFLSPTRTARRVRWAAAHRFADPSAITAPTMIVTGERGLDRVVPPEVTACCAHGLRDVRHEVLPRTGHIGIVTRPDAFADMVSTFADERRAGTSSKPSPAGIGVVA